MSTQLENQEQHQYVNSIEEEFHLIDLLVILVRRKLLIVGLPMVTGFAALLYSLMLDPVFTSTARIMPPQQQGVGISAMLGQLGGLASVAGGGFGVKNPNDLYIGVLESRTVADALITRMKLKEYFESNSIDDARRALASITQIRNDKSGLIVIDVVDTDPKFAANLANAYVEEFMTVMQSMALGEASRRRHFFEQQLKASKEQLENAEVALRQTQERTGMIQLEGQVQGLISSVAQLKGAIAAKEVQLSAMQTFATNKNPELLKTQEEVRGLKAQLDKIENGQTNAAGDRTVSTSKIPEIGIEYLRKLRNLKYHEAMFEVFVKQFESAKLDEAKEFSSIQQLDNAVPAERKSGPKRTLIVIAGFFSGLLLGILIAFTHEAYQRQRTYNERAWRKLSAAWSK